MGVYIQVCRETIEQMQMAGHMGTQIVTSGHNSCFFRHPVYQEEVPEALQSWFVLQSNQKQSITLRTGTGNANTFLLSEVIGFYAVRHDIYVLKQTHDSIQLYGRDTPTYSVMQKTV